MKTRNLVVLIGLVALALLLMGCAKESEVAKKPAAVAPEPEPTPTPEPSEISFVSEVSCSDNVLSATIGNTGSSDMTIEDLLFLVNSAPDATPGCDKEVLTPGETTRCVSLEKVGTSPAAVTLLVKTGPTVSDLVKATC